MGRDVEVEDPGHLGIEPWHEPIRSLDDGRFQPAGAKGLGHLQADVAAPDHDGREAAGVDIADYSIHIRDIAQDVDAGVVGPRDRWPDRLGPGAQHQLVVGLSVGSAASDFADLDFLGHGVYTHDFVAGAHVECQ